MTTTPSPEALALKACPFCESQALNVARIRISADLDWWQVECRKCNAHGPGCDSEKQAIDCWNQHTRPTPTDSGEVVQAASEMPPAGCLKCAPQWNSIELCDNCEQKFVASLSAQSGETARPEPVGEGDPYEGHAAREGMVHAPVGDEALVERMARDMRGAYGLYEGDVIVPWDRARPELKEAWLCCARAAIQAIPAPATDAGQSADSLVEQIIAFLRDDQEWGLLKNWSRFEFANEIERKFLPKSPSAGERV